LTIGEKITHRTLIILPLFILFFTVPIICADQNYTVLRDDFNTSGMLFITPDWTSVYRSKSPDLASCRARKGSACIYITGARNDYLSEAVLINRGGLKYWCENIEMKINCSNTNGLSSSDDGKNGDGGGVRIWGFYSGGGSGVHDMLGFFSASPESDPLFQGFWAISISDKSITLMVPINQSYLKESHTYSILWEQESATFLIDGEIIGETTNPPESPMGIHIGIDNRHLSGTFNNMEWGYLYLPRIESSIKMDYIYVFMDAQRHQKIPDMFPLALQTIQESESNDTREMEIVYTLAQDAWEKGYPGLTEMHLLKILGEKQIIEPTITPLFIAIAIISLPKNTET